MKHDDNVQSAAPGKPIRGHDGAQLAFQTVPLHGPFESLAGSKSHARDRLLIGQRSDGQQGAAGPRASSINGDEGFGVLQRYRGRRRSRARTASATITSVFAIRTPANADGIVAGIGLRWDEVPAPFLSTAL